MSRLSITVSCTTGLSNKASIMGGMGVFAVAEIDFQGIDIVTVDLARQGMSDGR